MCAFQYIPRYITEPGNGRSTFNVQTYRFSSRFFFILLLVTLQTYIWQKNWALLTDLLKVKSNMFLPDNGHIQKRRYSVHTHPWKSIGCFSWQLEYDYNHLQIYFKRTAQLWGSIGLCSVSSDNFFAVTYTCLSLVLAVDFCY